LRSPLCSLIAVLYLVLIVVLYSLPSHKATLPPPGDVYWFNIDGHHFVGIFPVFVFGASRR
jgi:amino acid permease